MLTVKKKILQPQIYLNIQRYHVWEIFPHIFKVQQKKRRKKTSLLLVLCEELTARPKETHLQPEITPSSKHFTKCQPRTAPKSWYLTGVTATRTRAHTHQSVSQSVREMLVSFLFSPSVFFLSFFSSFFFFFYWEGSFSFLFFFFLNRERRDDSKKGKWQWGVISKGNTTMLIALGPWKKEREKEGEFFLLKMEDTKFCMLTKKGLNIWGTGYHSTYTNTFQVYRMSS